MKYLKWFFLIILLVIVVGLVRLKTWPKNNQPLLVATFSAEQARYLGLDVFESYEKIIRELKPKQIRLQANWDDIEKQSGQFDFVELDSLISLAKQNNIAVTLAIGRKLPRWPECHDPDWLKNLRPDEVDERLFSMLEQVVAHYQANEAIVRWQLENEPLFTFGNCPVPNWHRLVKEVNLLRRLDSSRPILLTDSGELSAWWETASLADVQGVTLYRVTWNPLTGYFTYPLPAVWYRLKAALASLWVKDIIISELQLEPWAPDGLNNITYEQVQKSMSLARFNNNVNYFYKIGFNEGFVWGIEWWLKADQLGWPEYWQAGLKIFNK
ncbi:beta-galactosidase [Patescibacteria group bacterium]|nr:beta-galactosidase [Patescibacteria group bacterium]